MDFDTDTTEHAQLSAPAFLSWHPSLRKMRRTIEPMLDAGAPRAYSILGRLAILNGRPAFWSRPIPHQEEAGA